MVDSCARLAAWVAIRSWFQLGLLVACESHKAVPILLANTCWNDACLTNANVVIALMGKQFAVFSVNVNANNALSKIRPLEPSAGIIFKDDRPPFNNSKASLALASTSD